MTTPAAPPPDGSKAVGLINAVKGLTFSNLAMIVVLAIVAVPIYVIYKALGDDKILDRLMSTFEEIEDQRSGCAVRHVQERGGPEMWGVSSGFAFQGARSLVRQRDPRAVSRHQTRLFLIVKLLSSLLTACSTEAATPKFTRDQCRVLQQTGVDTTGLCPPSQPKKKKKANDR